MVVKQSKHSCGLKTTSENESDPRRGVGWAAPLIFHPWPCMFLAMVIKGGVFTAYDLATLVQTLQGLVQATTDSVIVRKFGGELNLAVWQSSL